MADIGTPTIDQIEVMLTVAEQGSFTAAAQKLNRATSAITYAIDHLESQLGVALFDRITTRRPVLTEAGRAVLTEARAIAHRMDLLRARVQGLKAGLEGEVSLAVDVMLPQARLIDALREFKMAFPTVALRLYVEALGSVMKMVKDGDATIGISGALDLATSGIERLALTSIRLIPVAAPNHPLARVGAKSPGAAQEHVQLVLTDRSSLTTGRDFAVIGLKTWRVADLSAKHALLLAGIGWGGMPEHIVSSDLEAGRLVELDLPDWPTRPYSFKAIYRTEAPPGPAGQWMIQQFKQQQ